MNLKMPKIWCTHRYCTYSKIQKIDFLIDAKNWCTRRCQKFDAFINAKNFDGRCLQQIGSKMCIFIELCLQKTMGEIALAKYLILCQCNFTHCTNSTHLCFNDQSVRRCWEDTGYTDTLIKKKERRRKKVSCICL